MALTLEPGNVYFLRMVDPSGNYGPFPFVKVGITRHKIEDRINSLKTGNPFEIVEFDSFHSEAASLIEQHVHRRYADRRVHLEWLQFSESELHDLFREALSYNDQLSTQVEAIRRLRERPSNGVTRPATEEELAKAAEMLPVLRESVACSQRLKNLKVKLQVMTGGTGGIPGVTRLVETKGSVRFDRKGVESDHPELYARYLSEEICDSQFRFVGKPRITDFPELNEERKGLALSLPELSVETVDFDALVERSADVEAVHEAYLLALAADEDLKRQLQLFEFEFCLAAGQDEGIESVCRFTRKLERKFERERFDEEQPELAQQYSREYPSSLRFSVFKGRDYA